MPVRRPWDAEDMRVRWVVAAWGVLAVPCAVIGLPMAADGDFVLWLIVLVSLPLMIGLWALLRAMVGLEARRSRGRGERLGSWFRDHRWADLDGAAPDLAAAVGWPDHPGLTVLGTGEGEVDGRRVALVMDGWPYAEAEMGRTTVWVERRATGPDRTMGIERRRVARQSRRSPATGDPTFDRTFLVHPPEAAGELPVTLLAAAPGLVRPGEAVTLAPGVVSLARLDWVRLDRLLPFVQAALALADAVEDSAAADAPDGPAHDRSAARPHP